MQQYERNYNVNLTAYSETRAESRKNHAWIPSGMKTVNLYSVLVLRFSARNKKKTMLSKMGNYKRTGLRIIFRKDSYYECYR